MLLVLGEHEDAKEARTRPSPVKIFRKIASCASGYPCTPENAWTHVKFLLE